MPITCSVGAGGIVVVAVEVEPLPVIVASTRLPDAPDPASE